MAKGNTVSAEVVTARDTDSAEVAIPTDICTVSGEVVIATGVEFRRW